MNDPNTFLDIEFDVNMLSEFLFTDHQDTNGLSSSDDDRASGSNSQGGVSTLGRAAGDRVADRKAKRKAQVAVSSRLLRHRKKQEMSDLRQEVAELTVQLNSLRPKLNLPYPNGAEVAAEELALSQFFKRRQAEKMNEQLRRALAVQRRFVKSLENVVLNTPSANVGLNMGHLLHTFTHLGSAAGLRRRDFQARCTDSKADVAIQILLQETSGMDFTGSPSISTCSIHPSASRQHIATTVAAYSFDTMDLKSVFQSACGSILSCGTEWPQYTTVSRYGKIIDKPQGNIHYGVVDTSYESCTEAEAQAVSVESRSVIFYRMGDDHGILVWDFVDKDDVYPVKAQTTMKRDLVGAAMVRREVCSDGVERVVYRSICTKIHSFSASTPTSQVNDYLQKTNEAANMCGFLIYNNIRERERARQAALE